MKTFSKKVLKNILGDSTSKQMSTTRKVGGISYIIEQKLLQSNKPTRYIDIQREVEKHLGEPQNIATSYALKSMQDSKNNPVIKVGRGLYTIKKR